MKNISVGLVGVTGYTGMELLRLLLNHPKMDLVQVTSRTDAGKTLKELHPFLQGTKFADVLVTLPEASELAKNCDIVFLAVPHGTAMGMAAELLQVGTKVVDLSADFRLKDVQTYESWYKTEHSQQKYLTEAVYGLVEYNAKAVKEARLVANPGCYPTSAILGLLPALKHKLIKHTGIVIDAKSGCTGAGRSASVPTLYCEVTDSFRAYNLTKHRHTPEIEQELSSLAGEKLFVSFNTHLLPVNRGILSTIYTELSGEHSLESIYAVYSKEYADKPWVRVLPQGQMPELRFVRGTMFCDLGLVVDTRTNRLIIVVVIDNLCRGASGQALANANLMSGLDIDLGLSSAALIP